MSRQTSLIVTILITLLGLLLGLQLKESDSSLMRYLSTNNAASKLLVNFPQARRAFTPFASSFSTTTLTMSSTSESTADPELRDANGNPLGLPEPPAEGGPTKLDMSSGSDTVKLDHLGPLVVNKDGSLSRISNWDQMTEPERKSTLRILGKRNQLRTEKLKKEEEEQQKA